MVRIPSTDSRWNSAMVAQLRSKTGCSCARGRSKASSTSGDADRDLNLNRPPAGGIGALRYSVSSSSTFSFCPRGAFNDVSKGVGFDRSASSLHFVPGGGSVRAMNGRVGERAGGQAAWRSDRPTDQSVDGPTDRRTNRPTDRRTDGTTGRPTDQPSVRPSVRPNDRTTD